MAWDPFRPWPRARAWVLSALGVLAILVQGPAFLQSLRPAPSQGVDFFQEWASARNVFAGAPAYETQDIALTRYLGLTRDAGDPRFIAHNAHPPTSILLAMPFARLPYPAATLAWNLTSLILISASLALVVRDLAIRLPAWSILPALALALTCNPLRQTINQGQLNAVLLLLLTAAWSADRRDRQATAGMLVALAASIKLFPAFLIGYFLLRRRWRACAAFFITLACVTAMTGLVIGWNAYRSYATEVLPAVSRFQSDWPNASIHGLWTKLLGAGANHFEHHVEPLVSTPALAGAATLATIAIVLLAWAPAVWSARDTQTTDRAYALSLTVMLLVSPICWDHYFLLLLLPVTLAWRARPDGARPAVLLTVLLALIWTNPLRIWSVGLPDPSTGTPWRIAAPLPLVTLIAYPTFVLLGVFCWLIFMAGSKLASPRDEIKGMSADARPASRLAGAV